MVFPRVALVRVHQTFGGCWYPSHIRHNETTAFTKNPPPFRDRGSVLAGFWPAPFSDVRHAGSCCASLPSTGTEPRTSVATCLTAAVAAYRLARCGRRADRRPDRRARPAGTRRQQSRHAVV